MPIGTVIGGMRVTALEARRMTLIPIGRETHVNLPEMVRVAGGTFSMGSAKFVGTQPIRQVTLRDYTIGKYPVTNGDYLGFLQATNKEIPEFVANAELAMHPVVNVTWDGAIGYCNFLMKTTGRKFSLPTEAQWEFAARGTEGRIYPWGNESYEGRVNFDTKGTTPVNKFPAGTTPSGIFDMLGNVWEWCADWYGTYAGNNLTNPKGPESGIYRVLRGGYWYNDSSDRRVAAYRGCLEPEGWSSRVGFRLAEDLG